MTNTTFDDDTTIAELFNRSDYGCWSIRAGNLCSGGPVPGLFAALCPVTCGAGRCITCAGVWRRLLVWSPAVSTAGLVLTAVDPLSGGAVASLCCAVMLTITNALHMH